MGYLKWYSRNLALCMLGGIFAFHGLSYSVAGRRALKFSGICKRGRQKGVSRICSENKPEQIGREQSKSEQIGAFLKTSADRNNRKKTRKSEQIGVTPFLLTPDWGRFGRSERPFWRKILLFSRGCEVRSNWSQSAPKRLPSAPKGLKFRRVTIRGAHPSTRLSEETWLSEGSQGPLRGSLRGLCAGSPRGSAGVHGIFDPTLVTLGIRKGSHQPRKGPIFHEGSLPDFLKEFAVY